MCTYTWDEQYYFLKYDMHLIWQYLTPFNCGMAHGSNHGLPLWNDTNGIRAKCGSKVCTALFLWLSHQQIRYFFHLSSFLPFVQQKICRGSKTTCFFLPCSAFCRVIIFCCFLVKRWVLRFRFSFAAHTNAVPVATSLKKADGASIWTVPLVAGCAGRNTSDLMDGLGDV